MVGEIEVSEFSERRIGFQVLGANLRLGRDPSRRRMVVQSRRDVGGLELNRSL